MPRGCSIRLARLSAARTSCHGPKAVTGNLIAHATICSMGARKRMRILAEHADGNRGFLFLGAGLVNRETARTRRWIDGYWYAGQSTQRRAPCYLLQRYGKSARSTRYQCRASVDQRNKQGADRLSFNKPDDLGFYPFIVDTRVRSAALHSPHECPAASCRLQALHRDSDQRLHCAGVDRRGFE